MKSKIRSIKSLYIFPVIVFAFFSIWWLYMQPVDLDATRNSRQLWGATYQILALYGAIIGIFISKKWGGYRSTLGRAILAFSIGLLLQSFGQTFSSYYVFHFKVESPAYPSIGDIGFFGSVLTYIYGVVLLSKASGLGFSLKKIQNKTWAFVIPLAMLVFSYLFFLKGYEFDWTNKVRIFLDFGYPLGQAFYVSVGILALLMCRNMLGGVMKRPILFLIFALIFQFFSDFFFLYHAVAGTWYVGNINDYLYCASYFIMTLSLIQMGLTFEKIRNS